MNTHTLAISPAYFNCELGHIILKYLLICRQNKQS